MNEEKNVNDNMGDMKILMLELNKTFTTKLLDQTFIIKEQQKQLNEQQEQLNKQRSLIDELAWQIRDMRDTIRKYCDQKQSQNHVQCPENHLKINIQRANALRQSNHVSEYNKRSPIYESINFDASLVAHSTQNARANKLQRQNAFDDIQQTQAQIQTEKSNQKTNHDIIDFLNRCIPPPPDSTPPRDTDSDIYVEPIEISSKTLERLNSLYGCKMRASIGGESEDGVTYRFKEFQHYSARSFRGSSKALCSFASSGEDSYLSCLEENENELQSVLPHKKADKSVVSNMNSDKYTKNIKSEPISRRERKPIYLPNDEVYI